MAKDKIKTTLLYLLIILVGILCALLLYFYQIFYKSDHYLPGVHITNLSVEGLTIATANEELENTLNDYLATPVLFVHDSYQYKTKLDQLCNIPATKEILKDIWQQEQERDIYSKLANFDGSRSITYPLKIDYNPEAIDKMVKEWNANLATDYVNASLEIDKNKGLVVIPGRSGKKVDIDQTLAGLPQEFVFEQGAREIKLPIVIQEQHPPINVADLQNMGELARYTTWYNTGEVDRTHNVKKASDSINGTVIAAGEAFSFNEVVGPRTYETGYKDAMVIVGGLFEPGLGGGICQVSSNLYNAVLLAGLDIVERHNHALAVAYVPVGRDATVAYGLQDFKFRNNTNYPIYVRSVAAGGNLTVNIYGDMDYKQKIEISNVVDEITEFIEVKKPDNTLPPGTEKVETNGIPGYIVRSFRTFFDQDGNKIKTERLATDRYTPLNKLVLVGPELLNNNPDLPKEDDIIDDDIVNPVPPDLENNNDPNLEGELIVNTGTETR